MLDCREEQIHDARCLLTKPQPSYLHDLRNRFDNLGLAAASYMLARAALAKWLAGKRDLATETRNSLPS